MFYAAYLAIELDIRLPFWVCLVAEWRRAVTSHLFTYKKITLKYGFSIL